MFTTSYIQASYTFIMIRECLSYQRSIHKDLTSDVVCKFQRGLCNEFYYGDCVRHLNVRIGEHIGISPPTKK